MGVGGQLYNPAINSVERTPLPAVEKAGLAPRSIWAGITRSNIPIALSRCLQAHKDKVHLRIGHEEPQVERTYSCTLSLT